jgi:signal transduction histidine kinase
MESRRNKIWVYGLLFTAWALILGWQVMEHSRVEAASRAELRNRAKDISTTVGIVLRSQRWFGVISKERIEPALAGLVRPEELTAVALLNAAGDVVASAPTNIDLHIKTSARQPELWEAETVTIINPIDLGSTVSRDSENTNPPVVLSRDNFSRPGETNRPPPDREFSPPPRDGTNAAGEPPPNQGRPRGVRGDGDRRSRFGRPPWMSEADFKTMIEKQGVHSFVIVLSTRSVQAALQRDFWLRLAIVAFTTLSVAGFCLAWRNILKSAELQIRLIRASEINSHLKEMNLAAAGLAHETRNPLNIIRGLAQMISKQTETSPETRQRSMEIVNEADRVAAQLNEFINYSRPREVRLTKVQLHGIANEVMRALTFDIEEKKISIQLSGDAVATEADEPLLRQVLFNLLLNAVQAVGENGRIAIRTTRASSQKATIEVSDDGPGVAAAERTEIFKPYFTTTQKGTGLGLAVVKQICLVHGWEIRCEANSPRGAKFIVSQMTLADD